MFFYDISPSYRLPPIANGIRDQLCFNNANLNWPVLSDWSLLQFLVARACELGVSIMELAADSQLDVYIM